MNALTRLSALALMAGWSIGAAYAAQRFSVDLELGAAWQDRNTVQSPNDASGTRFDLGRLTGDGPFLAPRLQLTLPRQSGHEIRLVAAPLRLDNATTLNTATKFQGVGFQPGSTRAVYRFDSYRATWRYALHGSATWSLKAGLTGKVRDAEISLYQNGVSATRSDIGFVPLLHLYSDSKLGDRSRLIFEADGLAGGPGRAFDLTARYAYDLKPGLTAFAGVRMLDGGVDQTSIYNFARFRYATIGVQVSR